MSTPTPSGDPTPIADADPGDQPHVDDFQVSVEADGTEWAVITVADGVRKVIERHSTREVADDRAEKLERTAGRYAGAPREEAVPDNYPGKGVDETQPG